MGTNAWLGYSQQGGAVVDATVVYYDGYPSNMIPAIDAHLGGNASQIRALVAMGQRGNGIRDLLTNHAVETYYPGRDARFNPKAGRAGRHDFGQFDWGYLVDLDAMMLAVYRGHQPVFSVPLDALGRVRFAGRDNDAVMLDGKILYNRPR